MNKLRIFTAVYGKDLESIKEKGLLKNHTIKNFSESEDYVYGCTKFKSVIGWEQKLIMQSLNNNEKELKCIILVYEVNENNIETDEEYYNQMLELYDEFLEEIDACSESKEEYNNLYETEEDWMSSLDFPVSEVRIDCDIIPNNLYYIENILFCKNHLKEIPNDTIFLYNLDNSDMPYVKGKRYCYAKLQKLT